MPVVKFTKTFLERLDPARAEKDELYWDEAFPCFGLRIKPPNTKSYIIQYNVGRRKPRMTICKYGRLTLDEARKEARKLLGDVAKGNDPARERKDERNAPTMAELAEDYLERHAIPNKAASSVKDDRTMLDNAILPEFGTRQVVEVSRRDVESFLLKHRTKPYKANRLRALLSKMFNLAKAWGWRPDNPVSGIPKHPEEARVRWLDGAEFVRFIETLNRHPNKRNVDIIRLLLLTGARRSEVFGARWDEIDLEQGAWTKPSHRTKQRRMSRTPLSDAAIDILKRLHSERKKGCPFVFPGPDPKKPVNDIKKFWAEVLDTAKIEDFRLHDLRHTFASHLASSGESLMMVGKLLGHTQSQTTMRYAHLADSPLRSAANGFGEKFATLSN